MLILRPYEPKLLLPVPLAQWREPSLAQPKDMFGRPNQTRFRLRAWVRDGGLADERWYDDRDEFDAELFRLPALNPWLWYEFATLTFLTSPTGSNQTYTSPLDWVNTGSKIETIGAGGSGGGGDGSNQKGSGAGGGAYNFVSDFSFAVPGTTTATYRIGTGGASVNAGGGTNGNAGGDSWFNGATLGAASAGSKGGSGGLNGATANGGAGGASGSGVGSGFSGGRGGNLTGVNDPNTGGSGGGGAAGLNGAGSNGVDSASTSASVETAGGSADNGSGGAGGSAGSGGSAGGNGTEWDATHGSGGGGGGRASVNGTGWSGGNYGGGGGGVSRSGTTNSGAGASGMVVVTYTPLLTGGAFFQLF